MIITIDGPSGTGKSTIAKRLAERLGYLHVNSGALYRSLAWFLLKESVDLSKEKDVAAALVHFKPSMKKERFFVGERDVTEELRTQEIANSASQISTYPFVRAALLNVQRKFADQCCVFEGRDMGTVVFPNAELKIFLMATSKVRAKRRLKELKERFPNEVFDFQKILEETDERDYRDSTRAVAPLKCPEDAFVIDSTSLTIKQVLDKAYAFWEKWTKRQIGFRGKEMKSLYRVTIFCTYIFFRLFYRLKIYGIDHFYRGSGIIAANHISFFDPPIIASSWPEEMHFLARESLFKGCLGRFITALNSHPIAGDAGDIAIFKKIHQLLKEGKKVNLYPEGSRYSDDEIHEIKAGVALIAQKAGCPIVPVYIYGPHLIWPRENKLPKLWGKITCIFGSPIRYEEFEELPKRDAMEAITKHLEVSLKGLRAWYLAGAKGSPP